MITYLFGMTKISFFQKEENYIREVCRSLINNPKYYAVTRRIMTNNKRDSMAVQKEIQWLSTETRIKAVEMKREEDQERCVRRQQSFWSEFIFFGKTFIHAKGFERTRWIWERKKKKEKKTRAEKKARVLRDPRTRHPPIYITSSTPAPFLRIPLLSFHRLFAGLCSLRGAEDGTSRACDFSFWLKRKYRYFFLRGFISLRS